MTNARRQVAIEQGKVLMPGLTSGPFDRPHRIVAIDAVTRSVWCIEMPGRRIGKKLQSYIRAPFSLDLQELEDLVRAGRVVVGHWDTPAHWLLSDDDYLADAPNDREKNRRRYRIGVREHQFNLIKPLIDELSPLQLVRRLGALRGDKEQQAETADVTLPTLYTALHRYVANGCMKNGLLPDTHRCGGAGKERKNATKRLGRPPKAHRAGAADYGSFILTEAHKEQIGIGYSLVAQGLSSKDAYLLCCGVFWSDPRVAADGTRLPPDLWLPNEKPTQNQFDLWGPRRSGIEARKRRFSQPATHNGGSSQDLTHAVGQLAMIDSTPCDVYLTSRFSRLKVLPPPLRTIVREIRCGVILGFHIGWEPASPHTAMLAIAFAAMSPEEKVAFAKSFGVDSTPEDWLGMVCRQYIADNGEMRAAEIAEAEEHLGITVLFAKTYHGAGKGDVEAQHYVDHCLLDHTLPGASTGKPVERGERHPAQDALWNFAEYMREYLEHVLEVNRQEVPELAPVELIASGKKPTRINIARWLIENGVRADVTRDAALLKALCLPRWPAVLQHDGVYLKLPGTKRLLPLVRFFNDALHNDHRYLKARKTRRVENIYVRLEPMSLATVWLPTTRGLIPLQNVAVDAHSFARISIWELIAYANDATFKPESEIKQTEQKAFEKVLRRAETTDLAKRQKVDEERAVGTRRPKGAWKGELKKNVLREQQSTASRGEAVGPLSSTEGASSQPETGSAGWSVVEEAQDAFLRSLQ